MNTRRRMRGFITTRVLLAALLFQLWAPALAWGEEVCPSSGTFAGGDGSANCPYLIATAEHLNQVRDNLSAHYRLIADIDLALSAYMDNWVPIGDNANRFTGTFDGGGHKIFNLANNPVYHMRNVGLFGYTGTGAEIRNVGLVGVNISGFDMIGGLVGNNLGGKIIDSYVQGSVSGEDYVGGLVGLNTGDIVNSFAEVAVTVSDDFGLGTGYGGGLAGYNRGSITNSFATGTVLSVREFAGGLVGAVDTDSIVKNSFATGNVEGKNNVGGLVGSNSGKIENSFATGNVRGEVAVGGLAGINNNTIENSYATGDVNGFSSVGGLAGSSSYAHIVNAYAAGKVTGSSNVGGLAGNAGNAEIISSYYDATGGPDNGWGQPRSPEQMKKSATYDNWDFSSVWFIAEDRIYPRLRWESRSVFTADLAEPGSKNAGEPFRLSIAGATDFFGEVMNGAFNFIVTSDKDGEVFNAAVDFNEGAAAVEIALRTWGTHILDIRPDDAANPVTFTAEVDPFAGGNGVDEPYLIANADQLNNVRDFPGSRFKLTADINLAGSAYGSNWDPIGNDITPFTGTFEGDGHKIINLTINRPEQGKVGLFGVTGSGAVIRNLGLENVNVTGQNNVGGLVGSNSGTITDSYAKGSVTANSSAGGLVGNNAGTVMNSYATGTVMADADYAGGLVGTNSGTIERSFAASNVAGDNYVGGLVGASPETYASPIIKDSYAAGEVEGTAYVGGLVGAIISIYAQVTNTYVSGKVTGSGSYVGGVAGLSNTGYREYNNRSYYDRDTTGQPDNTWGTPKSTDQMKRYATFAGWDFASVWYIHDGQTYPRLRWEEASWPNHSGFAVEPEEPGSKVYGEEFKLIITEAKGEFGQKLEGDVPVTVSVADGDEIFNDTVSFADGSATVTVMLKEAGVRSLVVRVEGVEAEQTVEVQMIIQLESIAVTAPPAKTEYFVGQPLDLDGLVVTGIYSDGSELVLPVTMNHISGFDSSAPATEQVVTVTYEGRTATFTVDIVEPVLKALKVTVKGEVVEYGDELEHERELVLVIAPDVGTIQVIAEADEDVNISLSGPDGVVESTGTAEVGIGVPEDSGGFEIAIALFKPDSDVPTVYTLIVQRMSPGELAAGINWNKLKENDHGYVYRFVTKGMTVGTLKSEFERFLPNLYVQVQNRDGTLLQDHEPVPPGARVFLAHEDKYQYIDTQRLSDHVREKLEMGESAPVTLKDIAEYVIREADDVTGDSQFDRRDLRLLLGELE